MDESLRNWCRESMGVAQKRFNLKLKSPAFDPEPVIEAAAFQRLSAMQGLTPAARLISSKSLAEADKDFVDALVASCPLNAESPPEVLGSIHEYLVVLRKSNLSGAPRISSKSRQSNGIFYTPGYVVNEIIQRTIGCRLEDASGEQDEIRILDPAAGCGAFLTAAFRFLIQRKIDFLTSETNQDQPRNVIRTVHGWKLTFNRCRSILRNQLFGVDLDGTAIDVTRRILWLIAMKASAPESVSEDSQKLQVDLLCNFRHGHALIGNSFDESADETEFPAVTPGSLPRFDWAAEYPRVAESGGFDILIGNPPYRREKDFKSELDRINATPLGRRQRTARMDLWYYFLHRGIQLLKTDGQLSFITNAYWLQGRGAEKVVNEIRDEVYLEELFLLRNQPIFPAVTGQHVILRLTKTKKDQATTIRIVPRQLASSAEQFFNGAGNVRTFVKTRQQLFRGGRLDVMPAADLLLDKLSANPKLSELGIIRQGIAENPAAINRRTRDRFRTASSVEGWRLGEGVFSLQPDEVTLLALLPSETELLRPYHDLCDLDRYWSAAPPSRQLIYSTRQTCPEITDFPALCEHLSRFRSILDARRETRSGSNRWWDLHWPRDDRIWQADKLVAIQMAIRPSVVPIFGPSYLPFSTNVFVPKSDTREDLRYVCGLLNSRVLWAWFEHHAKRRGIGLELNGHTLAQAPIRRIHFADAADVERHDELVSLVECRLKRPSSKMEKRGMRSSLPPVDLATIELESRIDEIVESLYGLGPAEVDLAHEITCGEKC